MTKVGLAGANCELGWTVTELERLFCFQLQHEMSKSNSGPCSVPPVIMDVNETGIHLKISVLNNAWGIHKS